MYRVWTYSYCDGWHFREFKTKEEAMECLLDGPSTDLKIILTKDVKLDILEENKS